MAITADQVLSVEEVAEILKVSQKTVRRMVKRGELKPSRIGRLLRFNSQDIEKKLGISSQKN